MSSIDLSICSSKSTTNSSTLESLPEEIIVQILQQTDPDGFASLVLLNRRWRQVSSQSHLYTHQLMKCPSYSTSHKSHLIPESLSELRRLFARETRRNLFEAYLRPKETVISLFSVSSAANSTHERVFFNYSLSPHGHYILAYNSYQIHILDTTGQEITVKRGYKILQRPTLVTITDDGCTLAVFSPDLQLDIYNLTQKEPKHIRAITLDHIPRTIALSPDGSVLAAAYDSGIEVSSLNLSNCNIDRRSVKCYTVDSLTFSNDGTQILGTTTLSQNPSTVVLTAPYFDTGAALSGENVGTLWTSSILFPNCSRDCSHAILLPSSTEEESSWAFTYDRAFETFRAVRIDDLRNGTTYFTGPIVDSSTKSNLLPSSLPTANKTGDLVASCFDGFIWLYGIPENLDAISNSKNGTLNGIESAAQTHINQSISNFSVSQVESTRIHVEEFSKIPQWQQFGDRARNTFVKGRNITFFKDVSDLSWVDCPFSCGNRLIAVTSVTGENLHINQDKCTIPLGEEQIMILDFDHRPTNGKRHTMSIEVGVNDLEFLEKDEYKLGTEISQVRKRNLVQEESQNHFQQESVEASPSSSSKMPINHITTHQIDSTAIEEDVFDTPYSHTSPRSGSTLRRAATAVAINRRLNFQVPSSNNIEYRRTDGQEDYPHESDADDWVPPPPPYSQNTTTNLHLHTQDSLKQTYQIKDQPLTSHHTSNDYSYFSMDMNALNEPRQVTSTMTDENLGEDPLHLRAFYKQNVNLQYEENFSANPDFDDRYDISPVRTPAPKSPKLSVGSERPLEVNEGYFLNHNKETIHDHPGSTSNDLEPLQQKLLNNSKRSLDLTLLSTRQNHSNELEIPVEKKFDEFSDHQTLSTLTSASKVDNYVERLSVKLPSSKRMVSISRTLWEHTPKMVRRITVPETTMSTSPKVEKSKRSSSYISCQMRLDQFSDYSENNVKSNRQRFQQDQNILPDSFHFSSENTLSLGDFSEPCSIPHCKTDSKMKLSSSHYLHTSLSCLQTPDTVVNRHERNRATQSSESQVFTKLKEANCDDSISPKSSKKIATKIKDYSKRKSLIESVKTTSSDNVLKYGNPENKSTHINGKQTSNQDRDSREKKCAFM